MNNCLLCGSYLSMAPSIDWLLSLRSFENSWLCNTCRKQFMKIDFEQACPICSKPKQAGKNCIDCIEWQSRSKLTFENHSLYEYNLAMKNFMHRYKFLGDYRLRNIFLDEMSTYAKNSRRLIVPIPLNPQTMKTRAFNQTIGFLDMQLLQCLETKAKEKSMDQSKLGRDQRKLMEQPFKMVSQEIIKVKDQDILIVDDVYTTGTTIHYAAQLLLEHGAKSVCGLTLAR